MGEMCEMEKLLAGLAISNIKKQIIECMLSYAYPEMWRKCQLRPKEWMDAFEELFDKDENA
jgi:hypothetical protein